MIKAYELKTEVFVGPIEKLLELIEEKKLDITTLSLSVVTADFLSYLKSLEEVSPAILADFIVVAARLILIKSKALMPELPLTEEEEMDIHDLERRLMLYKEFKNAGKLIDTLSRKKMYSYGRELFLNYNVSVFYPSANLTLANITKSLALLLSTLEAIQMREKNLQRNAIITIEQKMNQLVQHLQKNQTSMFGELAKNKEEMIALFLAILHLFKDRVINVEQQNNFSDIIIKPRTVDHDEK